MNSEVETILQDMLQRLEEFNREIPTSSRRSSCP